MSKVYNDLIILLHFIGNLCTNLVEPDRAERHDLKSRLCLLFSPFLFFPKKERRRKGLRIAIIVILSHAFLLDLWACITTYKHLIFCITVALQKILLVHPKCQMNFVYQKALIRTFHTSFSKTRTFVNSQH